ncbi:MAG: carboxypeptidase-like regulatory domain-containing protein [Chromatiales bacterium]|nr:carboxypeptidase-like regulatory domain-containing protein [Chromatiales bacterium]
MSEIIKVDEKEGSIFIDNRFIAAVILLFLLTVWLTCYSSADVEGRIVDAETGEPIAGAVVVGIWQLESQGFEHVYGKAIHVVESVSDAEGNYHLEGFFLKFVGHLSGKLRTSDPHITVFAEGYSPGNAGSPAILKHDKGFRRYSPYNGMEIVMKRVALDDRFVARAWESSIRMLVNNAGCSASTLTALNSLLESVEPRCDEILMKGYGSHCYHFNEVRKRCVEM